MAEGDLAELAAIVDRVMISHEYSHQMAIALTGIEPHDLCHLQLADAVATPTPDLDEEWTLWSYTLSDDGSARQCGIDEVPDATVATWAAVEPHLEAAPSRARFNDLLFVRGEGSRGVRARAAVEAYLEVASAETAPSLETARSLNRALHLARTIRDHHLEITVVDAAISAAAASLADPSKPGVTFRLLLPVANVESPAVDDILERCRGVFASPDHVETAIEMQRRRAASDDTRRALDRDVHCGWAFSESCGAMAPVSPPEPRPIALCH